MCFLFIYFLVIPLFHYQFNLFVFGFPCTFIPAGKNIDLHEIFCVALTFDFLLHKCEQASTENGLQINIWIWS